MLCERCNQREAIFDLGALNPNAPRHEEQHLCQACIEDICEHPEVLEQLRKAAKPKMLVVTVDETGNELGDAEWFDIPEPDHYATNGFDHIEPYVARLLEPMNCFRCLSAFTPDGNRGFGLDARDDVVHAGLTVEWREEPRTEAAIRAFFSSLGISPSQDYLAGNGELPDATCILNYPITGNTTEITALTKRILQELCTISPTEALDITYEEQEGAG